MAKTRIPAWRHAWRADDEGWLKQRKAAWKTIKAAPALQGYSQNELRQIREFFLSGSAVPIDTPEANWPIAYDPDTNPLPVDGSVLFECWLHPAPTEEEWGRIVSRAPADSVAGARDLLRECLFRRFPAEGAPFQGLEERLYRFFGPTRCRPADFPELSEASYRKRAWGTNAGMLRHVEAFLQRGSNRHLMAPALLDEFLDTLEPTLQANAGVQGGREYFLSQLAALFASARSVGTAETGFRPEQIAFSRELLERAAAMRLPDDLAAAVASDDG